tara:strand:+ start:14617 stop:14982 length:366 start_codon:yes stop_codon:yes gene_type:complete
MSAEVIELFVGDLTPIKNVRPDFPGVEDLLDVNWVCQTSVVDCDNAEVVAPRGVTGKTVDSSGRERFSVSIFAAETALLTIPEGEGYVDYYWIIEITNATTVPPFAREARITLRVRAQGIP